MKRDFAQLNSLSSIDADYRFGRPKVYLAPHELARLTILRSRLGDTQAERLAQAAGTPRRARTSPPHNRQIDLIQDGIWPL